MHETSHFTAPPHFEFLAPSAHLAHQSPHTATPGADHAPDQDCDVCQVREQANAALRAVWSRIEEEKNELRQSIHANVERVLLPALRGLEEAVPSHLRGHVTLVKRGLEEIVSPFVDRLSKMHTALTPVEIAIASLIKNGLGTKEIARLRHISPATVARHREHIRKKLGIANQKANLVSYLRNGLGEPTR